MTKWSLGLAKFRPQTAPNVTILAQIQIAQIRPKTAMKATPTPQKAKTSIGACPKGKIRGDLPGLAMVGESRARGTADLVCGWAVGMPD